LIDLKTTFYFFDDCIYGAIGG